MDYCLLIFPRLYKYVFLQQTQTRKLQMSTFMALNLSHELNNLHYCRVKWCKAV